jgi:hypothetical protein
LGAAAARVQNGAWRGSWSSKRMNRFRNRN